jgi:hypothetical protein
MAAVALVLLLAIVLGGLGFALHVLWWIALAVLVVWLLGFIFRGPSVGAGGRNRCPFRVPGSVPGYRLAVPETRRPMRTRTPRVRVPLPPIPYHASREHPGSHQALPPAVPVPPEPESWTNGYAAEKWL